AGPAPRQQLRTEFPLRRFLACPSCLAPARGYYVTGRRGGRFLYYDCANAACKFRVPAAEAHRLFVGLPQAVTPTPSLIDLFRRVVLEAWEAELQGLNAENNALQDEVASLRREKQALVELMKRSFDNPTLLPALQKDFERVEKRLTLATM